MDGRGDPRGDGLGGDRMGGRGDPRVDGLGGGRSEVPDDIRGDERDGDWTETPGGGRDDGLGGGRSEVPDDIRGDERDGDWTETPDGGRGDALGGGPAEVPDDGWRDERDGDWTETPGGVRVDGRDGWKQDVLEDFRQWLDAFEEAPPEDGEPEPAECDLHDLFAEFAALRQEVRLQNREQSRAGRELAKAAAVYETAAALAQRREEDLAALEIRVSRSAEDRCLRAVLEVRDALVRGREAAVTLRDRPRGLFRRPSRGTAGVAEGYELALRRFDRMLSGFGVRPVQTVGYPFDSRTMHAVEARRVESVEDGTVVEELRSGFVRDGEVLRLADVAVSRRRAEG